MTVRRALVTGASSGIGTAAALELAREGVALWITYAGREAEAVRVAEECRAAGSPDVHVSRLDLRDPDSIAALIAEITAAWDDLHVLVNNGGVCPYTPYPEIDIEEWDFVLETNARGTFLLTRAALPLLRAADGDRSVINIASIAGQVGALQTGIHYAASKGAILAITRSFARHLAAEGIRVNAVTPGPVASAITDQLQGEGRAKLESGIPLGAFGQPEDVAWIIASLASERARFITGATYDVNGGVRID
ncbi:SDR family oxidoreductase [Microbacterium paraoxydans]|jgi:3-oxoacyl-[acyl-carrier protein] reductase|uniref:SDR family NAD(P)-dependent oxidoreductase n=1 Tax=Microbacterium TaxID=33882 RepID=UPI000D01F56D|nr:MULTISPECIES: SDR family oxidoreductase [Microbacterium]AVL95794.1 short-chain dehydrogenase [Microbacterium sp. str. 'China']MCT2222945.1 SDR family oxidoreductase [Microbacterium paraoxydans]